MKFAGRCFAPRTGLFDASDLLDDPDGQRDEDNDDGGEGEPPSALRPSESFFGSHGRIVTHFYRTIATNSLRPV